MSHKRCDSTQKLAFTAEGRKRQNLTWESVRNEVLERINSNIWPPGELIPTESELAKELGCARATVNRALTSLAEAGLLDRRRKVGTRVIRHAPMSAQLERHVVRNLIEGDGGNYRYQLDLAEIAAPPAEISEQMILAPADQVLRSRAIFMDGDRPYCCEERWINMAGAPGLTKTVLERLSAAEWLVSNFAMTHANMALSSTGADPQFVAPALGITSGDPVLLVERVNWKNALVVSIARQYFPSEHRFSAQL